MTSDTIADMLTQIRNAMAVKKPEVILPYSRLKHEIAKVLESEKYILKVEKISLNQESEFQGKFDRLRLVLKYRSNGAPYIRHIKRLSKPSRRIYVTADSMPQVLNGLGIALLSTSKGLLTSKQARKDKVGGELMFEIW